MLFSFAMLSIETPNFLDIYVSVFPRCTVYREWFMSYEVDTISSYSLVTSILSTCPGKIRFGLPIPFNPAISATVVPNLWAIPLNVLPLSTV